MLDKILSWFISLWVGFAATLATIDIIRLVITAPSLWSGILAAQEKWFNPFNIVHVAADLIFLSPAIATPLVSTLAAASQILHAGATG